MHVHVHSDHNNPEPNPSNQSKQAAWNSDERIGKLLESAAIGTDYTHQAQLLAERECPVSTFFVPKASSKRTEPPRGFQAIASLTKGTAGVLNVNDPVNGAAALTDAVCKQILACLGKTKGVDLVSFYNRATF